MWRATLPLPPKMRVVAMVLSSTSDLNLFCRQENVIFVDLKNQHQQHAYMTSRSPVESFIHGNTSGRCPGLGR